LSQVKFEKVGGGGRTPRALIDVGGGFKCREDRTAYIESQRAHNPSLTKVCFESALERKVISNCATIRTSATASKLPPKCRQVKEVWLRLVRARE
jgi:hypothetical protein